MTGYWEANGYPEDAPVPGAERASGAVDFRHRGLGLRRPVGTLLRGRQCGRPARYTGARAEPSALPTMRSRRPRMTKYICSVCDYVYDPEVGDPDNGIEPGTAFEDLPDDWVCPECGVEKEEFEAMED